MSECLIVSLVLGITIPLCFSPILITEHISNKEMYSIYLKKLKELSQPIIENILNGEECSELEYDFITNIHTLNPKNYFDYFKNKKQFWGKFEKYRKELDCATKTEKEIRSNLENLRNVRIGGKYRGGVLRGSRASSRMLNE
jgi:hypothetical protein